MAKDKFQNKLKVLHIVSELTPLAKAGGLGDVTGYLPKAMASELHVEVKIVLPKYKIIDSKEYELEEIVKELKVKSLNNKWEKISVYKTHIPETIIPIYLIDCPKFFPGDTIYNQPIRGPKQLPFYFLTMAALEFIKAIDWQPDVIHAHDAMIGMLPKWLSTTYQKQEFYKNIASVFTIHNLQYQAFIEPKFAKYLNLKKSDFKQIKKYLKSKNFNIMAEAIDSADMVNTVSPTYAQEVLTKKYGAGLDRLLRANKKKFTGILNGMDYYDFDPRTNPDTPVKYWIDSLRKKSENKLYLQKKLGLPQNKDVPVICVVSRLVNQKGLDLIGEVLDELIDLGAQFVILGTGSKDIEKIFIKGEKENPKDIAAEIRFDADFAQTIYAGADMLLMPSRFEPCGLSQIIAMRFGTVPIVRKTGGLADTVKDGKTGFVFKHYDKNAFLWAIKRAVNIFYEDKSYWKKIQVNCMKKDFSWKASAKKYLWLYKKAIANHRKKLEETLNG